MAARHSIPTKRSRKVYSEEELQKRRYHGDVRKFKEWCSENRIEFKTHDLAEADDICVLSRDEYSLGDYRISIEEDNENYYLSPQNYEKWCER